MSMEKVIVSIIGGISQGIASGIIVKKQTKLSSKKSYFILFALSCVYGIISLLFIKNAYRFITSLLFLNFSIYYVLKVRNKNNFLYAFNTVIMLSISEIFISVFLVIIGIDSVMIVNNFNYNLLANILISLLSILLVNIPFVVKIMNKVIALFDKKKYLTKYLYIFLIIFYLIVSKNGLEFILQSNYYINILFMIGVILIITIILKNESKYDQLNEQNKQMLNYVTKYEKIITEQGKANHEFRNQLMVVLGYAQMNSPKLIEYLKSIVEDTKKTQSSYLISQLNKFPDGGIKGLLYYKLSMMDDEKIMYEISVETTVKSKLKSLDIVTYKNITKILGVFLDNAIDASKESKDKKIIISVSNERAKVIFKIFNTYKGKIDISKLGTGYTTKGKGHGYGLKLIKDIVNENRNFEINNSIENNYFVTEFVVLMGKKKQKSIENK